MAIRPLCAMKWMRENCVDQLCIVMRSQASSNIDAIVRLLENQGGALQFVSPPVQIPYVRGFWLFQI